MKITLNQIKKHEPCRSGWKKLLDYLEKTKADDVEFDLTLLLKSNGIQDAIWCLRCFDYEDYCLFLADLAESVLPIYEKNNKSTAPRDAITAIREYKAGNITKEQLKHADTAAYAAYAAAYAADVAAHAAYAAAAHAAYDAAYVADAVVYAAYAAAADAADADVRKEKWNEIEKLFIKHFS